MDEMKKAQDEMKELGKRSNISKTKPWIHRKHFGKEGKETWWKAWELEEPMQWTLQEQS